GLAAGAGLADAVRAAAVAAAAQPCRAGAAGRAGAGGRLAVVGARAGRPGALAQRHPRRGRLPAGQRQHAAHGAPLGRPSLGRGSAVDQPGPDQPHGGLERARRDRLDRRLAPRATRPVAGRRAADGRGPGQAAAGRPPAPGWDAGHRLVHRLRRAVHYRRLPGAGTAARRTGCRERSERMTATRAIARSAFALVALLPLLATAGERGQYARQWPLALGQEESGAYRVVLDETVYCSAIDPALGDVEVFNAAGRPLPAALL